MGRFGEFRINADYIKTHLEAVQRFFSETSMVVIRADYEFESESIKYTAISPFFDDIAFNQRPPEYEVRFNMESRETINLDGRTYESVITSIDLIRENLPTARVDNVTPPKQRQLMITRRS